MILKEFNQENNINDGSSIYKDLNHCNCLPSCTSIAYESEVSQAAYDWKSSINSVNMLNSTRQSFDELVNKSKSYFHKK